jgi:hypothetical protein
MATENDLVLVYLEEQPLAFARIEAIEPDAKPEWFQVKLLLLQVPLQTVTWILRPAYIDGAPFTMGGKQMRLEPVVAPETAPGETDAQSRNSNQPMTEKDPSGKVISFSDRKKT